MINKCKSLTAFVLISFCTGTISKQSQDERFIRYVANPKTSNISFYWKNEKEEIFRSIQNLKLFVESKSKMLEFAMNGGMFKKDNSPQGLYIENGVTLSLLDTLSGSGNFYLKPNGVFYLTKDNTAVVCQTKDFVDNGKIKFATQSGPMLLIDGEIHPAFKKGSKNLNIRNGVGILPDNRVVFVISNQEINFYDFASFFKSMNCKNALYLDGFVSRVYLPVKNCNQLDGNFGVIIGVSVPAHN